MDKRYIFSALLLIAILIIGFLAYKSQELRRAYRSEALKGINRTAALDSSILTEDDIRHLPEPVQKYIAYTGAIGKEKVHSFRVVMDGELRSDPARDFFKIRSEQYNFIDRPTRLYFLKANMSGLPVTGLHTYNDEEAGMLIKLAGLIPIVNSKGEEMRISDTTTLFNDMCFFAPAALIDRRIRWEAVDPLTARATFDNNGCKITAELFFNAQGEMVNFASSDRYYGDSHKKCKWSTPVRDYKLVDGRKVAAYAEAVWSLPEGDFCYGNFYNVKELKYNCRSFE